MPSQYLTVLTKLGIIAIALVATLIVLKILLVVIRKILHKSSLDVALHTFVINAIRVVIIIVFIVGALDYLGFDTKSLITILGVSGAAIALALKDSLSNVAGGIIILATKPFSRMDYVDIGGTTGTVSEIDLLITTLVTYDNKIITLPNGLVSTAVITNFSKANTRRVDCTFGIGYEADVSKAKELMLNVAKANPQIRFDIDPIIGVAENSDHSVIIDFKVWTDTENYWDVRYYLEENVKIAFDENNIKMPYPIVEVQLKK